jgi:uncharacterized protein (UPF0333 family)
MRSSRGLSIERENRVFPKQEIAQISSEFHLVVLVALLLLH